MRGRLLLGLAAAFACAVDGAAQSTGSVAGWIADSFGAPLSGVTVEARSSMLAERRSAVTAKNGTYHLSSLPPGRYVLRATRPGFASVEKQVTVASGEASNVQVILQLAVREKVLVSGDAPFVDTTTTTAARSYGANVLIHLPLDRNYADVARDHPGVVIDHGSSQGRAISIALNGSTSAESQWTIDGISTTNVMEGVQGKGFNNEAIEAVEVRTGGFQAEYGRSLGGIINVITKSGGNAFHGGAFAYYDGSETRAARAYDEAKDSPASGMRLADYQRADYGLDLGGYLLRDRVFFFGAHDRTDFPANVSRVASSEHVPNAMQFPLDGVDELYSLKLTWNPAPATTLVGTVFSDPTRNSGAGAADPRRTSAVFRTITNTDPGTWQSERTVGAVDYGLRVGQVVGSGFLGFQAARHQDRFRLDPIEAGLQVRISDQTCVGGTDFKPCHLPPEENFSSGGYGNLGGPNNNSRSYRDQFRADGTLYAGAHELKLGADYQDAWTRAAAHYSGDQIVARLNQWGTTYYVHKFFTDGVNNLTPIEGTSQGGSRETGAYLQDSWKAAPGVTINAGVRWDQESLRDYRAVAVMNLRNEWQPRLGIAWDPWRDGATNVYAFAGRFYYSIPTDVAVRAFGGVPKSVTYNYSPTDLTPVDIRPDLKNRLGTVGVPALVDTGLRGVSLDEITVGIERLIDPSLTVGLKATYRGLHNAIEDRCDIDYNAPGSTIATGCAMVDPGGDGKYARGDFYYCNGATPGNNCVLDPADPNRFVYPAPPDGPAKRIYKGIELVARKTLGDRLWLQASYVYSTLRGNYDGAVNEGLGGQTDPAIARDYDYALLEQNARGRLFLDRPSDFRFAGYYRTPLNLSIGLDAYVISGAPLDRWGYFNDSYTVRLVPRGSAGRMPTLWEANLTLEYPFRVGPTTVTLQGYVFNVFNNQIKTDQDQVWNDAGPYDLNPPQRNENYGLATQRQPPRLFRGAVRVSF